MYIIKSATSQQHKAQSDYTRQSNAPSPKFGNMNFSYELLVAVTNRVVMTNELFKRKKKEP